MRVQRFIFCNNIVTRSKFYNNTNHNAYVRVILLVLDSQKYAFIFSIYYINALIQLLDLKVSVDSSHMLACVMENKKTTSFDLFVTYVKSKK